jgi:hypothetical protein
MVGLMDHLFFEELAVTDVADNDERLDARQIEEVRDRHLAIGPASKFVAKPAVYGFGTREAFRASARHLSGATRSGKPIAWQR